jgi:hypothetical protein
VVAVVGALLLAVGMAPRALVASLNLQAGARPGVSVWGLGLVYVLPWLMGAWLSRGLGRVKGPVWRLVGLEWAVRPISWAGERLLGAVYWLGRVGEGEGWWGWALIVLSLAALFLTGR